MAIEIVEGVVGGGKTIRAVLQTLERLAAGGYVYTNVDMNFTECRRFCLAKYGVYIRPSQLVQLPEVEEVKQWWSLVEWGTLDSPVLCVIDEAQMFYNARDYADTAKNDREMLSFLTQSRKAGVDVCFITQDVGNIDKQFRVLAQTRTLARNMAHMRVPYLGLKLSGFIHYQFFETKTGARYDFKWWKIDKRLFKCYKTEAFLDSLMQELAQTKNRLERVSPSQAVWLRKLHAKLSTGDFIESWMAQKLRPLVAASVIRRRHASLLKTQP